MKISENVIHQVFLIDIHSQGTKNDGLTKKKIAKDYFEFLLYLLFHDYNEVVYDYDYNDIMLI